MLTKSNEIYLRELAKLNPTLQIDPFIISSSILWAKEAIDGFEYHRRVVAYAMNIGAKKVPLCKHGNSENYCTMCIRFSERDNGVKRNTN